jgi:hypothetical protein
MGGVTQQQPTLDDQRDLPQPGSGADRSSAPQSRDTSRGGRYGTRRRNRRPLLIGLVAVIAAVGIGWLIWAAAAHANPAVSGAVNIWHVSSDTKATFTLTVERPDPSVTASCRIVAQATNFETVGTKTVTVPAGSDKLVDVRDSLRTVRRATSVSLDSCTEAG